MPGALLPDGGDCRGLAGFFGGETLLHEGLLSRQLGLGGVGFHQRVNGAADGVDMAADEEHGVIETRLDVGNLGLDEAETAEEVVLRDKVGQGNALREEADIGPCGIERGIDESASAHAEFWNALAGLRCEVVHRRQDVPQLSEGSDVWRRLRTEDAKVFEKAAQSAAASRVANDRMRPVRLDGEPFTAQDYDTYRGSRLAPESMEGALQDLGMRLDLLMRPLADQPDEFRWMYRYLVQTLNKARNERGPGAEAMTAYAMTLGKAELATKTIGELLKIPQVAGSPQWKASGAAERFGAKDKAHVVCERYPYWPTREVLEDAETYLAPDHVFGERTVWRITLPDGKPIAVVIDSTRAAGLQGRLTPAMIEVKREALGKKAE